MLFAALLVPITPPTPPPKFDLTVESIMKGAAMLGHAPRGLRWSADGKILRFSWAKAEGLTDAPYKEYWVQRDGTMLTQGSPKDFMEPKADPQPESKATKEVYVSEKDLYIRDLATKASQRLTNTPEAEENPRLVLDETAVVFSRDGNLYRVNVADGATVQLTDIKPEPYPSPEKTSEALLATQQAELFKDLRGGGGAPTPTTGRGRGRGGGSFSVSPGQTHAVLSIFQAAPGSRVADVPNYVTRSGYSEMISTYPKVGELQSHSKTLVVDIKSGEKIEIACPRPGRVGGLVWSPDGKHAIVTASADDNKDNWIFGFDPATNKVTTLWDEHDDAWVGGPGDGNIGWLPDSSRVYFETK